MVMAGCLDAVVYASDFGALCILAYGSSVSVSSCLLFSISVFGLPFKHPIYTMAMVMSVGVQSFGHVCWRLDSWHESLASGLQGYIMG